ncbi:S41A family C-terminal processing peptidase-1 [Fluviicoccus keumensis]|uniref:S41A family C-terminal processing peptidase-1 n=1 Tax=Fluviicoccus keumensis TaxID=1435465 RepID=A0A4Q7Z5U1_9GAMM|nr:carboxy terminal-processing peptidase [Fluviicoccus keumensis]RZU45039.1 S41A family C-terminal processing peptidase-1 [Fluviicoccus keumensis]
MALLKRKKYVVWAAAFGGAVFFSAVFAKQAAAPAQLQPTADEKKAARSSVILLKHLHYEHRKFNDALSSQVLDRYLKDLDGSRSYFLASDINAFQAYRLTLDDEISRGDLDNVFAIYTRFQKRAVERLDFVLGALEKGVGKVDLENHQVLETKRDNAPWAHNAAELDDLWRKRLAAAVISLRLAGKSDEDIGKLLTKRYQTQLNNLMRTRPDDVFQAFMNSLAESYDPHTEYFSPRTSENFNINMSLSLEGIGAVLQNDDEYTKIVRLVPAGPAEKSKQLAPGDRIVAIAQGNEDFVDVVGWRIDEVVDLIRGPKGSQVRLQVIPAGAADEHQTKVVNIVRNTIKLEEQAAQKRIVEITRNDRKYRIGVIKLPTFYADFQGMQSGDPNYRSTTRDVRRLIDELKAEKIDGMVLDLRNNGGGSLTEANSLVGLFIETGPTVQIRSANGDVEVMGDSDPSVEYDGPLVVMVNRLSASAAEIFAGAIQDYGRGLIVGSTSFGKGTVQSLRDLNYGQLKVTEAKFYRISGASTQHKGVEPDVTFPNIYDNTDIGESALQNALPWDTIPPARYLPYTGYSKQLTRLRLLSQQRQNADPDFKFLNAQITLADALKKDTVISLNEKERRKEQDELDQKRLVIENARRKEKGQELLKTWREAEKANDADGNPDTVDDPDPTAKEKPEDEAYVKEAGQVLLDSLSTPEVKVARSASLHH